jgi:hypothetical protein
MANDGIFILQYANDTIIFMNQDLEKARNTYNRKRQKI